MSDSGHPLHREYGEEIKRLESEVARLSAEREELRRYLRSECIDEGCNAWPDDLHLTDVLEKYLLRTLHNRIDMHSTLWEQHKARANRLEEALEMLLSGINGGGFNERLKQYNDDNGFGEVVLDRFIDDCEVIQSVAILAKAALQAEVARLTRDLDGCRNQNYVCDMERKDAVEDRDREKARAERMEKALKDMRQYNDLHLHEDYIEVTISEALRADAEKQGEAT